MVPLLVVTVLLSVSCHSAKGQDNVKHHRIVILDGSLASMYTPRTPLAAHRSDFTFLVCTVNGHVYRLGNRSEFESCSVYDESSAELIETCDMSTGVPWFLLSYNNTIYSSDGTLYYFAIFQMSASMDQELPTKLSGEHCTSGFKFAFRILRPDEVEDEEGASSSVLRRSEVVAITLISVAVVLMMLMVFVTSIVVIIWHRKKTKRLRVMSTTSKNSESLTHNKRS